jgi:hypothetical protein
MAARTAPFALLTQVVKIRSLQRIMLHACETRLRQINDAAAADASQK